MVLPPAIPLSTPVTVTIWGTFQSAEVNVKLAGETVPWVESELLRGMVTFATGGLSSETVNWAIPPACVVSMLESGSTATPGGKMLARSEVAFRPSFGSLMIRLPNGLRSASELYWYPGVTTMSAVGSAFPFQDQAIQPRSRDWKICIARCVE